MWEEEIKLNQCVEKENKSASCREAARVSLWLSCSVFFNFLQQASSTFHFLSWFVSPETPLFIQMSRLLVLLLLLLEQFVDLPLDHGSVLCDDAVLVQAGQQQQEVHNQVGEKQVVHLLSDPGHCQQTADH